MQANQAASAGSAKDNGATYRVINIVETMTVQVSTQ